VIYELGPRARRVHTALQVRIQHGVFRPGDRLPSHLDLAREYGVAPMTIRHVLAQLEADGQVRREHGRGTFVCERSGSQVLIVDADATSRRLLRQQVSQLGRATLEAAGPDEALTLLEHTRGIALVLSAVQLPTRAAGMAFIRAVRRRWPTLSLAVVTGEVAALAELVGTPDWPLLILSQPVFGEHLRQILALALPKDPIRCA